jgi:hypothetical protein
MARNDLKRSAYTSVVENVPCCLTLALTVHCQTNSAYGDKCGFTIEGTDYFDGPPARVYQSFEGEVSVLIEIYRTPEGGDAQLQVQGVCTSTWGGDCTDPAGDGSVHYVWYEDGSRIELPRNEGDEVLESAKDLSVEGGAHICIALQTLFGDRSIPHLALVDFSAPEWADEHLPVLEADFPASDCDTPVEHYHLFYEPTHSVMIGGDFQNEGIEATGDLYFCHLITVGELIAQVQGGEIPEGEWESSGCCAERTLNARQTHYGYAQAKYRFNFTQPCTGAVRIRYKETTTVSNDPDAEPEVTVVDKTIENAADGVIITVEAPEVDEEVILGQSRTRCLSDFSIEWM